MYTGMCVDLCMDVHMGMCLGMCAGMYVDICLGMCNDMRAPAAYTDRGLICPFFLWGGMRGEKRLSKGLRETKTN